MNEHDSWLDQFENMDDARRWIKERVFANKVECDDEYEEEEDE